MNIETWNIEAMTGYKPKTTFYEDFSIAERFSQQAIKDTYKRAFESWQDNIEYITELAMALNWKCHRWYGRNERLSNLYCDLWETLDNWIFENKTGDDLSYYIRTTD